MASKKRGRNVDLNKQQLMGKETSIDIIHPKYMHLHPRPNESAFFEDEVEQSFDDFVEIGKRNPNTKGTGRWKLTTKRHKMAMFYFGGQYSSNTILQEQITWIQTFLSKYFQLDIDLYEVFDAVDLNDSSFTLHDLVYDIDVYDRRDRKVTKKSTKRSKNNTTKDPLKVEVFSLFDVLQNAAKEPYLTIIGLFDCDLVERFDDDGSINDILGRACGDRVACVSLPAHDNHKSLLCTIIHELLHTIGFDHCNTFQCVMNAIAVEDYLFLSPVNLKKLKYFHSIHHCDTNIASNFVLHRYEEMLTVLRQYPTRENDVTNDLFANDIAWLEEKIRLLKEVLQEAVAST